MSQVGEGFPSAASSSGRGGCHKAGTTSVPALDSRPNTGLSPDPTPAPTRPLTPTPTPTPHPARKPAGSVVCEVVATKLAPQAWPYQTPVRMQVQLYESAVLPKHRGVGSKGSDQGSGRGECEEGSMYLVLSGSELGDPSRVKLEEEPTVRSAPLITAFSADLNTLICIRRTQHPGGSTVTTRRWM